LQQTPMIEKEKFDSGSIGNWSRWSSHCSLIRIVDVSFLTNCTYIISFIHFGVMVSCQAVFIANECAVDMRRETVGRWPWNTR
jgi:hypothetical protein